MTGPGDSAAAAAPAGAAAAPALEVRGLRVVLRGVRGAPDVPVLDGVSVAVAPGETVALVGESGAGKTMLALAVMGLLPPAMRLDRGSVRLEGEELVGAPESALRSARGGRMAMVFQDAQSSLHPAFRVRDQIGEALRTHGTVGGKGAARARAVELLRAVGVAQPDVRALDFPHQLSGGLRQRVMIAMAIANQPRLLIADEATTALDVTVQAQVLDVLCDAQAATGAALLVVTHDLGVVAGIADRVAVMYAGRVVEEGSVHEVLGAPAHPYTQGLLRAVPRVGGEVGALRAIPGMPPSPYARPSGCAFHTRCALADGRCVAEDPTLRSLGAGVERAVACHHAAPPTA